MGKRTGVTINGVMVAWPELLPRLLQIWLRESLFRRTVWRCRCKTTACDRVPNTDALPGGQWSCCPYPLIRGGAFQAVILMLECAKVSPVAGWPDSKPAWLSWGVLEARRAIEKKANADAKKRR